MMFSSMLVTSVILRYFQATAGPVDTSSIPSSGVQQTRVVPQVEARPHVPPDLPAVGPPDHRTELGSAKGPLINFFSTNAALNWDEYPLTFRTPEADHRRIYTVDMDCGDPSKPGAYVKALQFSFRDPRRTFKPAFVAKKHGTDSPYHARKLVLRQNEFVSSVHVGSDSGGIYYMHLYTNFGQTQVCGQAKKGGEINQCARTSFVALIASTQGKGC